MGLDMYFDKRIYVKNWEHKPVKHKVSIETDGHLNVLLNPERAKYVIEEAAYWRKANHIHNWFVENVQEGEDNCAEYYVSQEKIQELLDVCEAVLKDKERAQELLPTASGFYFGDTEYDEWYFNDVEYTANVMREALAYNDTDVDFYYSSSW